MSAVPLDPYATLEAAGIPLRVLGLDFAEVCERLQDSAPECATPSDIYRKAGFYLDDRGTLEWEDDDMCELAISTPTADSVQTAVRRARELALRNPCAYHKAIRDLYGEQENRIIFAAMEDDDCQLGRIVRQVLQAAVVDDATQRVLDDIGDAS